MTRKHPVYTVDQDHPLDSLLSTDDQQLLSDLRQYMSENQGEKGIARIRSRLTQPLPTEPNAKTTLVASLACQLVDFATDISDEQATQEGLSLLRDHEDALRGYFDPGLYEYTRRHLDTKGGRSYSRRFCAKNGTSPESS